MYSRKELLDKHAAFLDRYHNDLEYREKTIARKKHRHKESWNDQEYRDRLLARRQRSELNRKIRYHNDPEYRKKFLERIRRRRKERWENDPEYRERLRKRGEIVRRKPGYREKMRLYNPSRNQRRVIKYHNDPEYRRLSSAKTSASHAMVLRRRRAAEEILKQIGMIWSGEEWI